MSFFVYILTCRNKKGKITYYTGYSADVPRRLKEHRAGNGARYTRGKALTLSYVVECADRKNALATERKIKSFSHNWKKRLIYMQPLSFNHSLQKQLQSISLGNK